VGVGQWEMAWKYVAPDFWLLAPAFWLLAPDYWLLTTGSSITVGKTASEPAD
jgi:hypothetical protein